MKKSYIVFILMLLTAAVFCSCAKEDFSSTLSCKELSSTLESEFSPAKTEFSRYTDQELKFLFPDSDVYNEAIVIYSTDSVDITEIGVMRAESEKDAVALLEDAKNYIKDLQEQKREFLQSYSPKELSKLNSAEAKRFGQYVVFAIAEQGDVDKVFKKAEMLLTK